MMEVSFQLRPGEEREVFTMKFVRPDITDTVLYRDGVNGVTYTALALPGRNSLDVSGHKVYITGTGHEVTITVN